MAFLHPAQGISRSGEQGLAWESGAEGPGWGFSSQALLLCMKHCRLGLHTRTERRSKRGLKSSSTPCSAWHSWGARRKAVSTWRKQLSLAESSEAPHGLAVAWMTWSLEHRGGERHAAGWGWEFGLGLRGFLNERAVVGWSLAQTHAPEVLFTGRRGERRRNGP